MVWLKCRYYSLHTGQQMIKMSVVSNIINNRYFLGPNISIWFLYYLVFVITNNFIHKRSNSNAIQHSCFISNIFNSSPPPVLDFLAVYFLIFAKLIIVLVHVLDKLIQQIDSIIQKRLFQSEHFQRKRNYETMIIILGLIYSDHGLRNGNSLV